MAGIHNVFTVNGTGAKVAIDFPTFPSNDTNEGMSYVMLVTLCYRVRDNGSKKGYSDKRGGKEEVLAASNEDAKQRCMEVYRKEKRMVKRCIYQSKKKVKEQFGRKMNVLKALNCLPQTPNLITFDLILHIFPPSSLFISL